MRESYGKDPASHPDPESCVGGRKDAGEALTGAHAGQQAEAARPSHMVNRFGGDCFELYWQPEISL